MSKRKFLEIQFKSGSYIILIAMKTEATQNNHLATKPHLSSSFLMLPSAFIPNGMEC